MTSVSERGKEQTDRVQEVGQRQTRNQIHAITDGPVFSNINSLLLLSFCLQQLGHDEVRHLKHAKDTYAQSQLRYIMCCHLCATVEVFFIVYSVPLRRSVSIKYFHTLFQLALVDWSNYTFLYAVHYKWLPHTKLTPEYQT